MTHEAPTPADSSDPARGPYRLAPIESKHVDESRRLIARAAATVAAGRAVVLGAGACDEIPLAELAARFSHVTLNDIRREPLEKALAVLDGADRENVDLHVADLTGVTAAVLHDIEGVLGTSPDAAEAIERMAAALDRQSTGRMSLVGKYDLVVASCLLSQLHFDLTHRAGDLFDARFPGMLDQLRGAARWTTALYQLARRIETTFIDGLIDLVADRGLIYLSESVQMCHVQLDASGQWQTAGTYRMLRTTDLKDYVDRRFEIVEQARWEWVVSPPAKAGDSGRLYDVQALVLRTRAV